METCTLKGMCAHTRVYPVCVYMESHSYQCQLQSIERLFSCIAGLLATTWDSVSILRSQKKNSGFYFVLRKTNVEPSALAAETLRNKSDCAIWLMSDRSPLRLPQDLSCDLGVLSAHIHAVMYTL